MPSKDELQAELIQSIKSSGVNGNVYSEDENSTGAFNSFLKIPSAGKRKENGELIGQGQVTYLYANSVHRLRGEWVWQYYASMYNSSVDYYKYYKAQGVPLRCISNAPALNLAPTANPGKNQTAYEGNPVTLSAANSSDSDGEIVSYEWSENGVVLSNDVNFTKDDFDIGVHTITLKVTDNDDASSEANVTVTINEFPKEELNSNGEYEFNMDSNDTKQVYILKLNEKSIVKFKGHYSDFLRLDFRILDENGTKMQVTDGNYYDKDYFSHKSFLPKGIYTVEFSKMKDSERQSGSCTFTYDMKTYSEIMQDPWFIDAPEHMTVAKDGIINTCLSIKVNEGATLDSQNLKISSDDLPDGLYITNGYLSDCRFNLQGKINVMDDFSVTLNISDGNITKEHKIDFIVEKVSIDSIIGDGDDGKVVIKKDNNGEFKPFKMAVNISGISESEISAVFCLFGDGSLMMRSKLYSYSDENGVEFIKCIFDEKENLSSNWIKEDFINKLVAMNADDRYVTIRIVLKDGSIFLKRILKNIPVVKTEGYISVEYISTDFYDNSFEKVEVHHKNGNTEKYLYAPRTIYVDYGDTIVFKGGRWNLDINKNSMFRHHKIFINMDNYKENKEPLSVQVNEDLHKTILNLKYTPTGKRNNVDIYVQNSGQLLWSNIKNVFTIHTIEPEICDDVAGVRGTTFKMSLTNHGVDYDLYEGELDINKSGKTTNLKTMQSYQGDTGKVKEITNVSVPSTVKKYFDETSLATADINSTVSDMEISTNSDKASFLLIGDHVRFGGGKVDLIKNIVEGNYTLRFLPLLWHKKPEDRNITFGKDNLKENITAEYQKIADVFVNGVAQDKKVDINVSSTNIRVDQLEDESLYLVTKVNDKNSSLNFSTMNSMVNVEKNGTVSTNIPLANDVRITIDKSGKVKSHIDDALLPKEDLPLGTQIKVIGDKVRFVVPMDKTLNF